MRRINQGLFSLLAAIMMIYASSVLADEGTWTFDNPPVKKIEERYGVKLSPEWFDHLRLSAVRLMDGGSGAFVSSNGLILTNHHVAADCIQKLSSENADYMKNGYGVDAAQDERVCPGGEADVLLKLEDVTKRVLSAVPAGASDAEAADARKAETAKIEKECSDEKNLRCEVVNLYSGGEYWLYRYRKYSDVRLVFAPEGQAAFFGGDPDNFNYPRYNLDFALFRVYGEDGRPVRPANHLTCAENGIKEGDLILLTGNPSTAGRLSTVAQLEFSRDVSEPEYYRVMAEMRKTLQAYAKRGPEAERQALLKIFSVENYLKVAGGYLRGLNDAALMGGKIKEENELRAKVASDPKIKELASAWDDMAKAQKVHATFAKRRSAMRLRGSDLYAIAADIVRLTAELPKPNEARYEEYRDSALESVYHELYSDSPIYPALEEVLLADSLTRLRADFGADDPMVKALLGKRTPAEVAKEAAKSNLIDVDKRKALVKSGAKGVAASKDPMIRLARAMDPHYRELRAKYEKEVKSMEDRAGERIARARFAIFGKDHYPDLDFTPAISYGKVAAYEVEGYSIPFKTTFYGMYERSAAFDNKEPFDLPPRWIEKRDKLNLATPFNFVNTADTFPGNSGSPIVNVKGELVGLLFDGNMQSLQIQYAYDEKQARSVAVYFDSIAESLRHLYGRGDLLEELIGKK